MTPKQKLATAALMGYALGGYVMRWYANRVIDANHRAWLEYDRQLKLDHAKAMEERIDKYNTLIDSSNLKAGVYNRTIDAIQEAIVDDTLDDHEKLVHIVDMALVENKFYAVAREMYRAEATGEEL